LATLVKVIVSRVTPPSGTGETEKAFETVSALVGVRLAVAAAKLLPPVVARAPTAIVLVAAASGAVVETVTGTVIVQVPNVVVDGAIGITPPESEMAVVPATAVKALPAQVVEATAGLAAIVKPAPIVFKLSAKLVIAIVDAVLGLDNVIVSVELPPRGMLVGLNALATVTDRMLSVAVAVAELVPWDVTSAPIATVLTPVVAVTLAST
jgi:hypothetical protein